MARLLDLIWSEILTPSGQTGPLAASYLRGVVGIGHAMLGAACCAALGLWGLVPGLIVAAIYWISKEGGDLKRGGDLWDGIEDALMVCLGAWYGAIWWPALMLACAGYLMAVDAWRRA